MGTTLESVGWLIGTIFVTGILVCMVFYIVFFIYNYLKHKKL